MVQILAKQV